MTKKIVAIGGGENGRIKSNGTQLPYELEPMDREIIKLTGKEHPNFLFLGHSQTNDEYEQNYYETMQNVYENKYNCHCQTITKKDLKENMPKVQELLEWADIIYEGGGDTLSMINLWKETGFATVLKEAWNKGKVMCGVSAGANCWFQACSSDSLKAQLGKDAPLISVHCLSLINLYFTPHCHTKGKLEAVKELLKDQSLVGISLSNCAALEIVDDKYRIIESDASNYGIVAYGIKSYWDNNEYFEEQIPITHEFRPLSELLSRNITNKVKGR